MSSRTKTEQQVADLLEAKISKDLECRATVKMVSVIDRDGRHAFISVIEVTRADARKTDSLHADGTIDRNFTDVRMANLTSKRGAVRRPADLDKALGKSR
jgi:hypothetical protein